jgi:FixJ family two-component response regulator
MYVDLFSWGYADPKRLNVPLQPGMKSKQTCPSVRFVGSDQGLLRLLEDTMPSLGLEVISYATGTALLKEANEDSIGCVVLDVRLPGIGGLELQARMKVGNLCLPFIFVTSHGDIALAVKAMKQGAFDFLSKPCRTQDLIDSVTEAVRQSQAHYESMLIVRSLRLRYESLTEAERKVMAMVVDGLTNKHIANRLCRSEMTVKTHRSRVMSKMEAQSIADLVRFARALSGSGRPH